MRSSFVMTNRSHFFFFAVGMATLVGFALPARTQNLQIDRTDRGDFQRSIDRPLERPTERSIPIEVAHIADAAGNPDAYRSGSDNARIADAAGNPDAYRSGSDNARIADAA